MISLQRFVDELACQSFQVSVDDLFWGETNVDNNGFIFARSLQISKLAVEHMITMKKVSLAAYQPS
ncbi:hypothetical protein L861_11640 [Litchfieldella anticariensis FP35 = DSM 16096]|uniref:Uncharacterized protein n=1 Tax=Litchfieldella anticariensis (strain DSM 16096 / CECT 5854 / CIP 108499 / LMG 22089 / FP35) TaxID=1121939 RepID=S2L0N2_LITA3|nr:hypothetical protein L861_11640 [Halomonas anticariensis FP35 = DSM 16096]